MSSYSKVIEEVKLNKQRRLQGKYNAIPWMSLPRLSKIIPGVEKEHYVICTASSKVGKSQLTDFLYVLEPYKFIQQHPDSGIKLKIFYFSLEMSKNRKLLSFLTNKIYEETGRIVSTQNINSKFANYILDDNIENLLDKYHNYFEEFEDTVTIVDNIRNPFGIYSYMKTYADSHGHYAKKKIKWENEDGTYTDKIVNDYYIPDDPNEFVIVITDHISLLLPEKGYTQHTAMSKYSSDYCLHMRDVWKYCVVNIQEQSAEQEKQQFTNSGGSVISKLRPSADGLGDNKLTGRDCNLILGLFAPSRYEIPTFNGYDISRLKDNYRELMVILNRDGEGTQSTDLLFNGAVNYFEELPKKLDASAYDGIINRIRKS